MGAINIDGFLLEDDAAVRKKMSSKEIKFYLKASREIHGIPKGDIDTLIRQFREDCFTHYCKVDDWYLTYSLEVLNNKGKIRCFKTMTAIFRWENKWGLKGQMEHYKIIVDDDMKILWIGMDDHYFDRYFISNEKKIYCISLSHDVIFLSPNICMDNLCFDNKNNAKNDDLIKKYRKIIKKRRHEKIEEAPEYFKNEETCIPIPLDEHLGKTFFYKGLRWNPSWKNHLGPSRIIFTGIHAKDDLFYIELENITYPHHGFVVLDLNELKIIEAGKI